MSNEVVEFWRFSQSGYFDITETVIGKHREPDIGRTGGNVAVGALGAAEVCCIYRAVGIERFGVSEGDCVARMHTGHCRRHHSYHILTHINNPFIPLLENVYGLQKMLHRNVWIGLRGEELHRVGALVVSGQRTAGNDGILARGSVARVVDVLLVHILPVVVYNGIVPLTVVVVGLRPVAKVEASIVGLTVKLVALAYRTAIGYLPMTAAADEGVRRAVLVGHLQLHQQLRQTVVGSVRDAAPLPMGAVVPHGSKAASLEDDTYGIEVAIS